MQLMRALERPGPRAPTERGLDRAGEPCVSGAEPPEAKRCSYCGPPESSGAGSAWSALPGAGRTLPVADTTFRPPIWACSCRRRERDGDSRVAGARAWASQAL
ncbi:hypothetical protein NDU88_007127 [Pleurodeles waltl]|uniref:Uncharacterized protein n=1 Tax=Pleurodeles waltl TaxID=8319 RepID=A0AAV7MFZ6_PLEWA|nr:hypothetical protein NDU88_007127 [Pleurodeles waltl]